MKYSIPLLGLFLITIPFASCTSEREKTAQIVTDNYVHFVDSIVNLNTDSARANWNRIDKDFEKKMSQLNIEIDKLEDSRDFDAKIDSATAKYETFKISVILQKIQASRY
ncbi:hypothetical protein ACFX5F_06140 [Flavobacterium sp. ZS1P70]|uniref:Uncharacterized protein n=1 Tax=Flavobacterium zhoui TaxID=3230414 RepID=A0ABW6I3L9_9FLAO